MLKSEHELIPGLWDLVKDSASLNLSMDVMRLDGGQSSFTCSDGDGELSRLLRSQTS